MFVTQAGAETDRQTQRERQSKAGTGRSGSFLILVHFKIVGMERSILNYCSPPILLPAEREREERESQETKFAIENTQVPWIWIGREPVKTTVLISSRMHTRVFGTAALRRKKKN